jgi:hypothetical protein
LLDVSRVRLNIRDINYVILLHNILNSLGLLRDSVLLLLATLRATLPIVLLHIVIKLEKILLDLQLFAHFNRELHALLHLMQSFLLFHELEYLQGVPFLLALDFLFHWIILRFWLYQNLGSSRRTLDLNVDRIVITRRVRRLLHKIVWPLVRQIKLQTAFANFPFDLVRELIDFLNEGSRLARELRLRRVRQVLRLLLGTCLLLL